MKKPVRRKGYDQGGQISSDSLGNSIDKGFGAATSAYSTIKKAQYYDALSDATKAKMGAPGPPKGDAAPSGPVGGGDPMARGGKIKRVAGETHRKAKGYAEGGSVQPKKPPDWLYDNYAGDDLSYARQKNQLYGAQDREKAKVALPGSLGKARGGAVRKVIRKRK